MNIADELMEYANKFKNSHDAWSGISDDLTAIADRINMEHERRMVERADLYSELRAKMNNCYIELPKDADGEYIHVGDVLTDDAEFESEGKVVRLMFENVGWLVGFDGYVRWAEPSIHKWHHHHAPTVEGVLREFALAVCKDDALTIRKDVIEEYAAKLQLAKEDA